MAYVQTVLARDSVCTVTFWSGHAEAVNLAKNVKNSTVSLDQMAQIYWLV